MADFNQQFSPGDVEGGTINVIVEIPIGSKQKIEWDRVNQVMKLDRLEPATFPEPTNYGFIPQTISGDGDGLDVLIISETAMPAGKSLQARIIGVMWFEDEGEVDDKIVVVPVDEQSSGNAIKTLADIPKQKIDQITYHFTHHKDLKKPNSTIVKGWGDITEAKNIINRSIERWNNQ